MLDNRSGFQISILGGKIRKNLGSENMTISFGKGVARIARIL